MRHIGGDSDNKRALARPIVKQQGGIRHHLIIITTGRIGEVVAIMNSEDRMELHVQPQ